MPITPGSLASDLNGVTPVTVTAAPGASTYRSVVAIRLFNLDSAAVTVTLQKNISGTKKTIAKITALAADGSWTPVTGDLVVNLVATTESLEMFMSGAAAATNPHVEAEYVDKS